MGLKLTLDFIQSRVAVLVYTPTSSNTVKISLVTFTCSIMSVYFRYFVLKTLKVAKKPVAVLVENGRSMGMNLSQLNEKGNGREKKRKKKGGLNPL